jgi:HAD superfamily hydrolase (TIGR01549 family)
MKRGVIFDLDDTLADTTEALQKTRLTLIREVYGTGTIDPESALRCWRSASEWFGPTDITAALRCVGAWHNMQPLINIKSYDWSSRYEQLEVSMLELVLEVPKLLDYLNSENYALAIVANGNVDQQRRKFQALGLKNWFDEENFIICDGLKLRLKPAPDGVTKALKKLGVTYSVLIGDRRSDMIAGFLAGCKTVRVLRKSGVARQGPVWLHTIGDPDLAVPISGCEEAVKRLFDGSQHSKRINVKQGVGT